MSTREPFPQQYDPEQYEQKLYDFWEESGFFKADPTSKKPKYVMMLPPPNVTGVLHMGHALTGTLEDVLVRRKRMQGYNALWLPGTDHAGIATQMVVERMIGKEERKSRHDLGREKFLERVWEWKEKSQGTILRQLRVLGSSLDWSRLHFTLDEGVSRAVRETFVRLYNDKLLYRDEAMIQWCPRCRTALSDLEVKPAERRGKLWHLRYKDAQGGDGVVVATTRPETLLGDVAVAVNPADDRYKHLIGKTVLVPLVDRPVPVIGDEAVDLAFGTGALKITPAHDPVDYAIGKKHKLPVMDVFDEGAVLNDLAGPYKGLTREKAREQLLAELTERGLLVKEQDHTSNVGTCDRCGTLVEPRISYQWFVNAAELAKDAIKVVRSGEIKILPKEWEKTYFQWMENIRPWCVSRQLWWGHRIPAWHCTPCRHITVALEAPKACEKCGAKELKQDEDVLDTWFSSGLWPFSTLGWPAQTADLKAFYPNDVLETGFDILFFWVARMIMLGIRMAGNIPFHTVYLHPMVRDEAGQKMSKTKGNVKDPLEIIDRLGADPLRFTLCAMAVHGRDVLLSDSRIEGYRNFVNKIWNGARFVDMHFGGLTKSHRTENDPINAWIWAKLDDAVRDVNQSLEQYRFFDAANRLYEFFWREYCDWYLELIKPDLEDRKKRGDSTPLEVLETALRLLHPIVPFVTEAIWQRLPKGLRAEGPSICVATYPEKIAAKYSREDAQAVDRVVRLVEAVRSKRGEANLKPSVQVTLLAVANDTIARELMRFESTIARLCNAAVAVQVEQGGTLDPEAFTLLLFDDFKAGIPRDQLIDAAAEREKVEKDLEATKGALQRATAKLASKDFADKAPQKVVDGVREEKARLEARCRELEDYAKKLAKG